MPLHIYNSLTQKKEEFIPLEPGKVRMYVCGVTVYDECHLGHARAAVVFDVIFRYLQYLGFDVTYVRNFTDVDDKIINKAKETGEDWRSITERYISSYKDAMKRLGVKEPTHEPLATGHIEQMLKLIADLEKNGYAYSSGGDVFYAVRKFKDYGKLSHKRIDDLEVGARIEVNEQKKDPLDFVLWKAAKPGEPKWDSPWGEGRPGWHIECSSMSMEYLGKSFDIHGGGRDLIFPHHENEIAQSEGATGKPFAKHWIHNGFVNINAEKMSKSLGNIRTISVILDHWDPEVVRYFLLEARYNSPLDFHENILNAQTLGLTRFYENLKRILEAKEDPNADLAPIKWEERFKEAMDNDFNTPVAIARIYEGISRINGFLMENKLISEKSKKEIVEGIKLCANVLGVFTSDPYEFLKRTRENALRKLNIERKDIDKKIEERKIARQSKDWARADKMRDELAANGILLQDNADGTTTWSINASKAGV